MNSTVTYTYEAGLTLTGSAKGYVSKIRLTGAIKTYSSTYKEKEPTTSKKIVNWPNDVK